MRIRLLQFPYLAKLMVVGLLVEFLFSSAIYANNNERRSEGEQQQTISGIVTSSEDNLGLPGVNVIVKGTSIGTITDMEGFYEITVPESATTLTFSFVGFQTLEREIGNDSEINVVMETDQSALEEVVIVGYGTQKKETVVGAVSQTNSEVLERTGGVSDIGAALTGALPGLVTSASTGIPGGETPQIVIRGQNSWNGTSPLILVDGVERPGFFTNMSISSVESISVLKDASATAVFGSRGANGVIIVTTKRGLTGAAEITANFSSTMKVVSKLPGKYDAYDAIGLRNRAIEYELSDNPASWGDIIPEETRYKYLNPASLEESERYPNVDWQEILFKDYAMAYNANLNIRGGTDFVKYFATLDFQNEGDLFRDFDNNRGYDPGYEYNRLNFRSNLDFQITPTTKLRTDLGGTYGVRRSPWGGGNDYGFWDAAYRGDPTLFMPQYSDGIYGYYAPNIQKGYNSVRILSISGVEKQTTARISTTFVLDQDLSMILEGLNFNGTLAVDNTFLEGERGVNDLYNDAQEKWIDPETGRVVLAEGVSSTTGLDFYTPGPQWSPVSGNIIVDQGQEVPLRRIFYQLKLDYANTIAEDHNYNLMGLMNRQKDAIGNGIPAYREDWVFRATYNYKSKYMLEYNGAYNGSEKFAPEYRFAFFSSGGLGWMVTNEEFMDSFSFLDMLKLRASYGEVGDDNIGARFLFMDEWGYGGNSQLGLVGEGGERSPYAWYTQEQVGNPFVRWETVYKYNLGMDFGIFKGLFDGSIDVFRDNRIDILMAGDRAVPSYFGADAPAANLGRVRTQGYEITLGVNHTFANGLNLWADFTMTHAKDEILDRDDPALLPDYQKQAGYALGQTRTHIASEYYNTWDELYASTVHNTNNLNKIPGNYQILDYNGDGIIDTFDSAPFGYSGIPQNTFSTNVGFGWKGFTAFAQFYGVNNVTRNVSLTSLGNQSNTVFEQGTFWSKDVPNADTPMPRWSSVPPGNFMGHRYYYDASYLRLKNAEIAYRFDSEAVSRFGLQNLRVYINGNNLLLWTEMPDDRESNFSGIGNQGAYPTVKRFNLGLNMTF
ncbi:SusC/RagA family TonB-linked outer membrane protein [Autumnicola psychrophila]|uniref:SusC/RagA family TonB-linked outer membrane protein n=1 Tax=Autumnicola psychrophila TaxID=3075592 RepID=A0ABU3DMW5_9FLAO|nr:SusC/RagA family TonB-linked outer membrane protein [Zunongwangia sp. F225]MDT0685026.1 SusC/RagA family TonB-linked outer membrane protein [Zunongwangia sp. F225]